MEGGARLPGQCRRAALPWAGGGDGGLGKGGQWWPPGTAPGGVKAQSGPASSVSGDDGEAPVSLALQRTPHSRWDSEAGAASCL